VEKSFRVVLRTAPQSPVREHQEYAATFEDTTNSLFSSSLAISADGKGLWYITAYVMVHSIRHGTVPGIVCRMGGVFAPSLTRT
jgi:hypothetical protein